MSTAVKARGLTVHYGDVLALDDVDVTVERGRICGLLGMNGSGKSTLFKSLIGLVKPDRGAITLHDKDPAVARREGLVAYVPQSEAVDWAFPVRVVDVVSMGRYGALGGARRLKAADRAAVDAALERVGLTEFAGKQIGELSGGQRKRAFVARGIAQEARLLFLDEPFAGVDKRSEATIVELLRSLRDEGRTIVVSTHDLAGVPALCDEAILLRRKVLLHSDIETALSAEHLGRAFGLDGVVA
ncbi:metal ABC transporter ATP-binding protein [Allokutzneria albata]